MHDEHSHEHAVDIARLTGRLETYEHRLEHAEKLCSTRSDAHVDWVLYRSERDAIRRDIDHAATGLRDELAALAKHLAAVETTVGSHWERTVESIGALKDAHAADMAAIGKDQEKYRRWLVGMVLVPAIMLVAGILSRVVAG